MVSVRFLFSYQGMSFFEGFELHPLLFQKIDAIVDHDALHPGADRRFEFERADLCKHIDEGVLQHVFRIQFVFDHPEAHVEHGFGIKLVQLKLRLPGA